MNVRPSLHKLALFSIVLMIGFLCQSIAGQQPVVPNKEKSVYFSVADKYGRFVSGLRKEQFALKLDDFPQLIKSFSNEDEVMTVGILVDKSGSQKFVDSNMKKAIFRFLSQSNPSNEYFMNSFNEVQIELLDFTQNEDAIRNAVDSLSDLSVKSNTAVHDAIDSALIKMDRARFRKRVLLVFSDFIDNASKVKLKKLEDRVRRRDVQIYSIVINSSRENTGPLSLSGLAQIETFTNQSGGRIFEVQSKDEILEVCERIALNLRNQYKIGFEPIGKSGTLVDENWHDLDVKLSVKAIRTSDGKDEIKGIRVFGRSGIFVSK